ncbi:MAG: SGNH/GDSL hydrolase family protein [Agathobacter sp.]
MINYKDGIVNKGDWTPIQRCMKKAQAKEAITVAFLGGSITQGSLSSTPETCYAYLVFDWWQKKFPQAKVTYVNAGIGGTTSQFGVARVKDDVLSYSPDFLLTEFSVNDDNNAHYKETFEGLIRAILSAPKAPALMLAHNYYYKEMVSAEEAHLEVGKHYDLPCVSMKSTIYAEISEGKLTIPEISPDGLHPNDAGHKLVSEVIIHLLEEIYKTIDVEQEPVAQNASKQLPAPLTLNRYENSIRYQNYNSNPKCEGFVVDMTPQNHITECFRKGYVANETGSKISFELNASCIAVQYRKSVKKPAPIAKLTIDNDNESSVILDANFAEDWGDCLYIETVYEALKCQKHTVDIEIIQGTKAEEEPFYLVSVIGSGEERS